MNDHPLDIPARAALTSRHSHLARRSGGAICYDADIVPFAADDESDPAALARLVAPGQLAAFLQAPRMAEPDGFETVIRDEAVQLVATRPFMAVDDARIEPLGPSDAAEMLALAEATKPGPFTLRALDLGRFYGIRQDGELLAMAGERMACDGYVEVSGVCVAETARGQGLARLLSQHVAAGIAAAGDVPFLHAFASNDAAIGLYRSLGFEPRAAMQVGIFRRLAAQG